MSHSLKRRVTVLATSIMVLLVAGVAFAAWTSTATGNGSASALDHTDTFTGLVTKSAGADLYPGDSADVVVTVTNNQDYPVKVDSISAGTSDVAGDCAAGSVDTASTTLATRSPLVLRRTSPSSPPWTAAPARPAPGRPSPSR